MSEALQLLQSTGAIFGASAEGLANERCVFALRLLLTDGSVVPYKLEVADTWQGITVKEVVPSNLPGFCPQRHINSNGTFCLAWWKVDSLGITSTEDAKRWWGTLWKFLTLQARAGRLRRWPNNDAWAHGDAASHQKQAEDAAAKLGKRFFDALKEGEIAVELRPKYGLSPGPTLEVFVRNKYIYSVWLKSCTVVNKKQRCFCGSSGSRRPARLRRCLGHAAAAAELALQMALWEKAEQSYWQGFQDKACCGTCDVCPLQEKQTKRTANAN